MVDKLLYIIMIYSTVGHISFINHKVALTFECVCVKFESATFPMEAIK